MGCVVEARDAPELAAFEWLGKLTECYRFGSLRDVREMLSRQGGDKQGMKQRVQIQTEL